MFLRKEPGRDKAKTCLVGKGSPVGELLRIGERVPMHIQVSLS